MHILLLLAVLDGSLGQSGVPSGLRRLGHSPPEEWIYDAIGMDNAYVSLISGRLHLSNMPSKRRIENFPFSASPPIAGNVSAVAQVRDSWLIGVDMGEFGGGMWWFNPASSRVVHILIPKVAAADDAYAAENVVAFVRMKNEIVALVGLDHLGARSGRVCRVDCIRGACAVRVLALLDGAPRDWIVTDDTLLILTHGGVWQVTSYDHARCVYTFHSPWWLQPTSFVRLTDGTLFVGMEHFVLRLGPGLDAWEETWFETIR
jgi:hypothetical protein